MDLRLEARAKFLEKWELLNDSSLGYDRDFYGHDEIPRDVRADHVHDTLE